MGRRLPVILGLVGALCGLAWAGCSGPNRPKTAPVSGHVTYQGKPVPCGQIIFQPEQGRPAMGTIGPDGSYQLTTFDRGDGALLGRHHVTVEATRVSGLPPASGHDAKTLDPMVLSDTARVEWLVPQRYSVPATSGLSAEVKPGRNTIDFNLPAEPGKTGPK